MVDWKKVFDEIASEIYRNVKPIFHTRQAAEIVGKGAGGDLTRHVDALAENVAIKILEKNNASCVLVSEEIGTKTICKGGNDYIILDPVDGSTNAFRGIPFFCVSIALAAGPRLSNVKLGLIKDLSNGATFTAEAGKGAYEGKTPLKPSPVTTVDEALIGVEVSIPGNPKFVASITPLIATTKKIRHLGSTALETCYVAAGLLDAFVDSRDMIRATDIAAAYLMVREAGGIMVTPDGSELDMALKATERTSYIAAGNKALCNDIIRLLKTK